MSKNVSGREAAPNWAHLVVWFCILAFTLVLLAYIVVRNEPFASKDIARNFTTVVSLLCGVVGATLPGELLFNLKSKAWGFGIRATAAPAFFCLSYFFVPVQAKGDSAAIGEFKDKLGSVASRVDHISDTADGVAAGIQRGAEKLDASAKVVSLVDLARRLESAPLASFDDAVFQERVQSILDEIAANELTMAEIVRLGTILQTWDLIYRGKYDLAEAAILNQGVDESYEGQFLVAECSYRRKEWPIAEARFSILSLAVADRSEWDSDMVWRRLHHIRSFLGQAPDSNYVSLVDKYLREYTESRSPWHLTILVALMQELSLAYVNVGQLDSALVQAEHCYKTLTGHFDGTFPDRMLGLRALSANLLADLAELRGDFDSAVDYSKKSIDDWRAFPRLSKSQQLVYAGLPYRSYFSSKLQTEYDSTEVYRQLLEVIAEYDSTLLDDPRRGESLLKLEGNKAALHRVAARIQIDAGNLVSANEHLNLGRAANAVYDSHMLSAILAANKGDFELASAQAVEAICAALDTPVSEFDFNSLGKQVKHRKGRYPWISLARMCHQLGIYETTLFSNTKDASHAKLADNAFQLSVFIRNNHGGIDDWPKDIVADQLDSMLSVGISASMQMSFKRARSWLSTTSKSLARAEQEFGENSFGGIEQRLTAVSEGLERFIAYQDDPS